MAANNSQEKIRNAEDPSPPPAQHGEVPALPSSRYTQKVSNLRAGPNEHPTKGLSL